VATGVCADIIGDPNMESKTATPLAICLTDVYTSENLSYVLLYIRFQKVGAFPESYISIAFIFEVLCLRFRTRFPSFIGMMLRVSENGNPDDQVSVRDGRYYGFRNEDIREIV
jgi:hypothetical protein